MLTSECYRLARIARMKVSPKKLQIPRRHRESRSVVTQLRDRQILPRRASLYPEFLQFVDDVTAVSTFDNNHILNGVGLRSTFMVVFSHDRSLIASSHGNHKIKVCRLDSLECIQTLGGHPRSVWSLSFHPSSNDLLASGCLGGQVRVWDLQGRSEIWNCDKGTTITSLSFHPHERLLAIATGNQVLLWDWSHPAPFVSVEAPAAEEYIRLIRFDHHGHHLLTGITNTDNRRGWADGIHYGSRQSIPRPGRDSNDEEEEGDVPMESDVIPEPSMPDSPPDGLSINHQQPDATTISSSPLTTISRPLATTRSPRANSRPWMGMGRTSSGRPGDSLPDGLSTDQSPEITNSSPLTTTGHPLANISSSLATSSSSLANHRPWNGCVSSGRLADPPPDGLSTNQQSPDATNSSSLVTTSGQLITGTSHPLATVIGSLATSSSPLATSSSLSATPSSSLTDHRPWMRVGCSSSRRPQSDQSEGYPAANKHSTIRDSTQRDVDGTVMNSGEPLSQTNDQEASGHPISTNLEEPGSRSGIEESSSSSGFRDSEVLGQTIDHRWFDLPVSTTGVSEQFEDRNEMERTATCPRRNEGVGSAIGLGSGDNSASMIATPEEPGNVVTLFGERTSVSQESGEPPQPNEGGETHQGFSMIRSPEEHTGRLQVQESRADSGGNVPQESSEPPQPNERGETHDRFSRIGSPEEHAGRPEMQESRADSGGNVSQESSEPSQPNERGETHNRFSMISSPGDSALTSVQEGANSMTGTSEGSSLPRMGLQGTSSRNGLLTSTHTGSTIPQRRTPSRVVRVQRQYDGPELVQVRVISEQFQGAEGRPPRRLTAEDLSQAVIIRTEETFHIPDLPESLRRPGESLARALLFDSDNSNDGSEPTGQPPPPSGEQPPPQPEDRSPFTGLPIGSSLLDHIPNRDGRVEQQVTYPVSGGDGMVGRVTVTRSTPADRSILRALQLQRNPGNVATSASRRTQGARRILPTQLSTGAGGRRGIRNHRDEEGPSQSEVTRRSRLSRFGFARTAVRRRSGRRRQSQNVEDDMPGLPQGEHRNFINQALADAFRGRWSNPAVANNINSVTHRLQWWEFKGRELPDISDAQANILVPCCKLYSDASCDISPDERFLVTFVPYNFPDQFMAAAYSLEKHNFGTVLFTKKLGAEAITLSISPSSTHLLVGLATSNIRCPAMPAPMAMICRLSNPSGEEGSMELLQTVNHSTGDQPSHPTGLNIAKWVPTVGAGFVYGTVKGDLRICKPRYDISRTKPSVNDDRTYHHHAASGGHRRYSLRSNARNPPHSRHRGQSTQTRRRTHSAGTQTDLTSRYIRRRRLNPPHEAAASETISSRLRRLNPEPHEAGSERISSRLAINMADAFNNWSPAGGSSTASVNPTAAANDSSAQPTPDTTFETMQDVAVGGEMESSTDPLHNPAASSRTTTEMPPSAELDNPAEPSSDLTYANAGLSNPTATMQDASNIALMMGDSPGTNFVNFVTSSNSATATFGNDSGAPEPSSGNLEGLEVTLRRPASHSTASCEQRPSGQRVSPDSTTRDGQQEGAVSAPQDDTQNVTLGSLNNSPRSSDVHPRGSGESERSNSRSSQVDINGAMVSLSGLNDDQMTADPTAVNSSDSSLTLHDSTGPQTSSESSS